MTVQELIEKLQKFHPDTPVYKSDWDGACEDTGFDIEKSRFSVSLKKHGEYYPNGELPDRVVIE